MTSESLGHLGFFVVAGLVSGVISALIASKRHRSSGGFFILGFALPVIGIIVSLLVPPGNAPVPDGMRPVVCPRCNARQNVDADQSTFECWQCRTQVPVAG